VLDINLIREQPDLVRKAMADRQMEASPVDQILELDRQRRLIIQEAENLKAQRNTVSKEIGKAKGFTERRASMPCGRSRRISKPGETCVRSRKS
jgi:seryl-tRNA synthetase